MEKKSKIALAVFCILVAGIVVFTTRGNDGYDTNGKLILLKCEQCSNVIEMDAEEYEKKNKELTEGLSAMEIISNKDVGLKCESCGAILRIAHRNSQTNKVEILGKKSRE